MVPRWLMSLLVLLREAWSGRRDAHIQFLKLQPAAVGPHRANVRPLSQPLPAAPRAGQQAALRGQSVAAAERRDRGRVDSKPTLAWWAAQPLLPESRMKHGQAPTIWTTPAIGPLQDLATGREPREPTLRNHSASFRSAPSCICLSAALSAKGTFWRSQSQRRLVRSAVL